MRPCTPRIELDLDQLLGFERLAPHATSDGRISDPRAAMVGISKPPQPQPDDADDGTATTVARLVSDPRSAETLCAELVAHIRAAVGEVDLVVAPAIGGVVTGYEVARQLGARFAVFERIDGRFEARGGPEILPDTRCAVVDDTVLSGRAMQDCIEAARAAGASVVVGGCLLRDAQQGAEFDVPLVCVDEDGEALARRAGELDAA